MKKARILAIWVLVLVVGLSVGVAKSDFTFGTPMNLGPVVNSSSADWTPSISTDGLELFFCSDRSGGYGADDLWIATWETTDDDWGTPTNLGSPVNTSNWEQAPSISADGLTLFFSGDRPCGVGSESLWVMTRETKDDPWGTPVNLGPTVNSSAADWTPSISADGLELFFTSNRSGGYGGRDLWVTTRETIRDDWRQPINLGPAVNLAHREITMSISHDGLLLFFGSDRPGGLGGHDLWITRRETSNDPWGTPVNLGPTVNSTAFYDQAPNISADGSTLFFSSNRTGGFGDVDIYQVSIEPVVDLNGDGIVDAVDMCIIVDNWGTDNPLCDIGPTPFGDGIVDIQDLIVLSEHLFVDVNDPTLIAHWPLDEVQGDIAYNDASDCDGTLIDDPVWQPDGGMVGGTLQFDGIDDYVSTDPVLNPADGTFSVFAWIKGGAPGQVVISQQSMANWLIADAEGKLMTELKCTGRSAGPLLSETVITDRQWHRIGLVWDGSHRTLYVDGVAVADDTQQGLEGSQMGLYIGTGKSMESGTYFSGLIDDVRIYNRAVHP